MTTAQMFLGYVGVVAVIVVLIAGRWAPRGTATAVTIGLPIWLAYVAAMSWFGALEPAPGRPLGMLFVFVPVVLFMSLGAVRSRAGLAAATAIPLVLLHSLQVFRLGVELLLHRLWEMGLAPHMLTYEGANLDIWVALSAPVAALIALAGRPGLRLAVVWNVAGILMLVNVIVRSVLTSPGPLNLLASDVPNTFVSTFPYSLLPGFFAPLALALHILSLRAIRARLASHRLPNSFSKSASLSST